MKINVPTFFSYNCETHFSCNSQKLLLKPGVYIVECAGASGGNSSNAIGGSGVVISGVISIQKITTVYLYIGASGDSTINASTFNGGGRSCTKSGEECTSGGGGTDIRLIDDSTEVGLTSRIIVAAGGGGAFGWSHGKDGGNGGFFKGDDGGLCVASENYNVSISTGGSDTDGGLGSECKTHPTRCYSEFNGGNGVFGYGGDASNYYYGGGGGGGYFGGGGGGATFNRVTSGAGGSSYVSGYPGFHSFEIIDNKRVDRNTPYHYSNLFFSVVSYRTGAKGNYGNGHIVITKLSSPCTCLNRKFSNFSLFIKSFCLLFMSN